MDVQKNKTHAKVTGSGSAWKRYADVMIGRRSLSRAFYFEGCLLLGCIPGALGMLLRNVFWPRLFGSCGKGVQFAEGITLRHPHRIHIGNRVVISERCTLDARTPESERVIVIGDDVMISVGVMLSCKGGSIHIGANTGIGPGTIIQSTAGEGIEIGRDDIIAASCFLTGGGNYSIERLDIPIRLQEKKVMGGLILEENVWVGAKSTILGGLNIGQGSVIGAGSVVTRTIPPLCVCVGVPAKIIRRRGDLPVKTSS
jgi:acetyltransferase-like isoleucine patch superfamily enzyme